MTGVERRPASTGSLAHGVSTVSPGTLSAQSVGGGITVGPRAGRTILAGRFVGEVHVPVGVDDLRVSRIHITLTCEDDRWWVRTAGRTPVRLPARRLFPGEEPLPLAPGYTPLFVQGSAGREHLLELFVVGSDGGRPQARPARATVQPSVWILTRDEQLALIVLGQRYLRHEPNPQPLSRQEAAAELAELQPAAGWTDKRVEHLLAGVRKRMSRDGVPGLTREEIAGPVGNALNHNLIQALVLSTTLVPPDLIRLDLG